MSEQVLAALPAGARIDRSGYCVLHRYASPERCAGLLDQIAAYRAGHSVPTVERRERERSLRYAVIDGPAIRQFLPDIERLYIEELLPLARRMSGVDLVPLAHEKACLNINITPPGGEYRWHYDRNAVTAILYLNAVPGGETELYPNYRIWLGRWKHTRAQQTLDRLLMHPLVRRVFGWKRQVAPRQGTLLLMRGDRSLHSVAPVGGSEDRINIIMSFDDPAVGMRAGVALDTYLYTQQSVRERDPNYSGTQQPGV